MSVNGFIHGAVTVALSSALTTVPEGSANIVRPDDDGP